MFHKQLKDNFSQEFKFSHCVFTSILRNDGSLVVCKAFVELHNKTQSRLTSCAEQFYFIIYFIYVL